MILKGLSKLKTAGTLVLIAFREWIVDRCDGLGSAMAFHAMLAVAPFFSFIGVIAEKVFGEAWTRGYFLPALESWAGPRGSVVIRFLLIQTEQIEPEALASLTVLGLVGLVVGASGFFLQLQDSLETIWNVRREKPGIRVQLKKRFFGLVYALASAMIVFAGLAVAALVSAAGPAPSDAIGKTARVLIVFLTSWGMSLFWFRVLPPVRLSWRQILPWAALIGGLVLSGRFILTWHVGRVDPDSNVDAAASLILVILWFYYASLIFLYGAELMRISLQRSAEPARDKPPERSQPLQIQKGGL